MTNETSRTLLIVGGDSKIGMAIGAKASRGDFVVIATTRRSEPDGKRPFFDLAEPSSWSLPATDGAVLAAAITSIEACRRDVQGTARLNVENTIELGRRIVGQGAYILYLSTNQVFDGCVANVPSDASYAPVSEYGRQKAAAEVGLRALGAGVGVLRLGKVLDSRPGLFMTWHERLQNHETVSAFADMTIAPVTLDQCVQTSISMLKSKYSGIVQLSGNRDIAYSDIAKQLADKMDRPQSLVLAGSVEDADPPVSAPVNTTMDATALIELGMRQPDSQAVIDGVLNSVVENG